MRAAPLRKLKPINVEGTASAQVEQPHLYNPTSPSEPPGSTYDAKRLVQGPGVLAARANGAAREGGGDFRVPLRRGHHRDDPDVSSDDSAVRPSELSHRVTQD